MQLNKINTFFGVKEQKINNDLPETKFVEKSICFSILFEIAYVCFLEMEMTNDKVTLTNI